MRDDVIGLLDHLGLRQVILVGHSMGATVACLVTIARPDLVARLIIEDAPLPFPRNRPVPGEPAAPAAFDWPVVPASISVGFGRPVAAARLRVIQARLAVPPNLIFPL